MLLISIHFQSRCHLGLTSIHVSSISIQALILASHLIPSDFSTPSRSRNLHLGFFQVTANPPIQVSKCGCQMLSGPFSPPSRTQDSTKAPIYMPHLHLGRVSPPSRARLTPIQISRIASQLHLSPISPYADLKMYIPSQSRANLTPIHVSRICASPHSRHLDSCLHSINSAPHLNPGLYIYSTHHHSSTVSFPSWPMYLHLTSIHGKMYVPPASWLPITTIHVVRIVSQLHPSPISSYPGLRLCVATQSRSILNPIQVSRFVSHLHPGSQLHVSSSS